MQKSGSNFFSFWNFNNFDYFAIWEKNNFEIRYHISQKLCNLIKYFAKSYFSGSQLLGLQKDSRVCQVLSKAQMVKRVLLQWVRSSNCGYGRFVFNRKNNCSRRIPDRIWTTMLKHTVVSSLWLLILQVFSIKSSVKLKNVCDTFQL